MIPVWSIDLDDARALRDGSVEELSTAERERAERFRFDRDRDRWLAGRIALRRILARELGVATQDIAYGTLARGKPFLSGVTAGRAEFNLSHAGACALVGISRDAPIGVDVEFVKPMDDLADVAERHFAVEERAALFALPREEQLAGFYRLWTRKEAYIKAIGTGLGHALDRFAVSLTPEPCRFIHLDGDRTASESWSLLHLTPRAEFVGAVAVPRAGARVQLRDFDWRADG